MQYSEWAICKEHALDGHFGAHEPSSKHVDTLLLFSMYCKCLHLELVYARLQHTHPSVGTCDVDQDQI